MKLLSLSFGGVAVLFGSAVLLFGSAVIVNYRGARDRLSESAAASTASRKGRPSVIRLLGWLWVFVGLLAIFFGLMPLM
ncbi:hypothetical protein GCM10010279_32810 [Streptomyces mutabilis]|nr:hypothetical protein GCM10010279_32810 [Streptomyces mutabilis]